MYTMYRLAPVLALTTASVLKTGNLRKADQLLSEKNRYYLTGKLNKDNGPSIFDAELSPLDSPEILQPVALKCTGGNNKEVSDEYHNILILQSEVWCPRVFETFQKAGLTCFAMERLGQNMVAISQQYGLFSFSLLYELGLRMLEIIKTLHFTYKMGHRTPLPNEWVIRDGEDDVSGLVLVGLHALRPLTSDPHGYHSIMELQQLAMTLRFLRDLDMSFFSVKKLASKDINVICPSDEICPKPLRDLLLYVLSVNPQAGRVPADMYGRVEELLREFPSAADSSAPVWLRGVPAGLRGSVIPMPDPALIAAFESTSENENVSYAFYDVIGVGSSGLVYEGASLAAEGGQRSLALKCRDSAMDGTTMDAEFRFMELLQSEVWCPHLYEKFVYTDYPAPLSCIAMEKLADDLHGYSTYVGGISDDFKTLMVMGTRMLDILQELHSTYGIVHGDVSPTNWMVADWNDPTTLVLIDYGNASTVAADTNGYQRIRDIRRLVLSLRYLRDMDAVYYGADDTDIIDAESVCPSTSEEVCPAALKSLVEYTFAFDNSTTLFAMPDNFYETVRQYMTTVFTNAA